MKSGHCLFAEKISLRLLFDAPLEACGNVCMWVGSSLLPMERLGVFLLYGVRAWLSILRCIENQIVVCSFQNVEDVFILSFCWSKWTDCE